MARVLRTSLVAPSPSGPERALPFTYLDALWLHAAPVERVFYYYPDAATPTSDVISALEDSLSRALAVYYPLAGRLRLTSGTTNRYELYYRPGDAVTFAVAEYDYVGMDELVKDGNDPTEVAKVVPLVPPLPDGGAVLALQATILRGGGLALGLTVHHGACDGVSSTRFLHTWACAAASRTGAADGDAQPEPPVIERGFIRDRDDLYDIFVTPRLPSDADVDQLLLAAFTLSKEHLQSVKDTVAREAERRGVPTPRSTSIVAAFGLIWQCYVRAKRPAGDCGGEAAPDEGPSYFLFSADHRARLDVPAGYLGNCVGPCLASAPRKEIGAGGSDGLFTACAGVGAAVDHMVRGEPGYWEECNERVMAAYGAGEPPLSVAGSPRFRVYDLDFGFGRPAKVDVVSVARTGAISVAEERGGRGGGIEVGIYLPECGMARFRECFGDAMASLSHPIPGQYAKAMQTKPTDERCHESERYIA